MKISESRKTGCYTSSSTRHLTSWHLNKKYARTTSKYFSFRCGFLVAAEYVFLNLTYPLLQKLIWEAIFVDVNSRVKQGRPVDSPKGHQKQLRYGCDAMHQRQVTTLTKGTTSQRKPTTSQLRQIRTYSSKYQKSLLCILRDTREIHKRDGRAR